MPAYHDPYDKQFPWPTTKRFHNLYAIFQKRPPNQSIIPRESAVCDIYKLTLVGRKSTGLSHLLIKYNFLSLGTRFVAPCQAKEEQVCRTFASSYYAVAWILALLHYIIISHSRALSQKEVALPQHWTAWINSIHRLQVSSAYLYFILILSNVLHVLLGLPSP